MTRALFIGDSHTCGFVAVPGKVGPGSYETWQDNNYALSYARINNKQSIAYAQSGAPNHLYTNWLKSMFNQYSDIDEVFILLAPLNRFVLACSKDFAKTVIGPNHFTVKVDSKHTILDTYVDDILNDDSFQLLNKPTGEDYNNFPGIEFDPARGLLSPNLRRNTFMEVKLFFEMNTHLEQQQYFQDIYTWDNICADNNAKLYLFNMASRAALPSYNNYYGSLKTTTIAPMSIEEYFAKKFIDHSKYFLADKEHYNKSFHDLIASQYIPWIKSL